MYIVFAGQNYYPGGGMNDYKAVFESLEDALEATANASSIDWWQIAEVVENDLVLIRSGCRK